MNQASRKRLRRIGTAWRGIGAGLRRRWRRVVLIGALCGGGLIAGVLAAALATPRWYKPPVIAPEERQKVRNSLVAAEQTFTESLRAGQGRFTYQLMQDDVNRWITMRREIYPLLDELTPPQWQEPFVALRRGTITIAGQYRLGPTAAVISVDIVPRVEDDALVLRATAVRCGSVRVPLDIGGIGLGRKIERRREETWPGSPGISGDLTSASGLRLEARAWWKNGGLDYRVVEVRVEPGVLSITVEPLGRGIRGRGDQGIRGSGGQGIRGEDLGSLIRGANVIARIEGRPAAGQVRIGR